MSTEYIRAIKIRSSNVYITSRSSSDDEPYHNWLCESLSEVYQKEGQRGLDREVMSMICEYAVLVGRHESLARYYFALKAKKARKLRQQYKSAVDAAYALLTDDEKKHIYSIQTESAKQYRRTERDLRKQMYTAMAELCAVFEKRKNRMEADHGSPCKNCP